MNPWLIVFALLSVLGAGAGGFKLGADHEVAAQARNTKHVDEAVAAANLASAEAISRIKVTNSNIYSKVQHEVTEKIVYRDCRHSDVGLQHVNAALAGRPVPAGGGELPAPDAPK